MIELNFSNMMEEVIGAGGLSKKILEDFKEKVEEAHKQIQDRSWPELAFMDLPFQDISEIKKIARAVRKNSKNLIILGIGGSALGPRALLEALSPFHNLKKGIKVFIYDNVDPRTLDQILSLVDLKRTSINVISKSGSTAETAAFFMILWDEMKKLS